MFPRTTWLLLLAFGCAEDPPLDVEVAPTPPDSDTETVPPTIPSPTAPFIAPHILLVLADDIGWTDLATDRASDGNGSDYYLTPRLDELAEMGSSFPAIWTAPVCGPGRALAITGVHAGHSHIYSNPGNTGDPALRTLVPAPTPSKLEAGAETLASRLRSQGYRTGHFGKWHLGDDGAGNGPLDVGFDVNRAGTSLAEISGGSDGNFAWEDGHFDLPDLGANGVPYQFSTDRLVDEALAFFAEDPATPTFVHLSVFAVHNPIQAPADDLAVFEGVPPGERHDHLEYAAMLYNLDRNIGELLDWLAATPEPRAPGDTLLDHTIVVFTADNGGEGSYAEAGILLPGRTNTDNAPLTGGKGTLREGGLRVPFILRAPGRAVGHVIDTPIEMTDLTPTLLDLAGAPVAEELDGISLVPLLDGETLPERLLVLHFPTYLEALGGTWRATPTTVIRNDTYKLWYDWESREWRLYDLVADIGELTDIAGEHPDIVAQLGAEMITWLDTTGAFLPVAKATQMTEPLPVLP